jgi:glycosyltransferase involved in cell wall biosynthesis
MELLSICIPTRNRAFYLNELLTCIYQEVVSINVNDRSLLLKIYISDNASSDQTQDVVKHWSKSLPIEYSSNYQNIGAGKNVLLVSTKSQGKYTWILGDDELIFPGSLLKVFQTLESEKPGLLIATSEGYNTFLNPPRCFSSYRQLAQECIKLNPHFLIAHTLISCNIFKSNLIDTGFANYTICTNYGQMYGLIKGLNEDNSAVILPAHHIIIVRDVRAEPVDGIWPNNISKDWIAYLYWIKHYLQLEELVPEKAIFYRHHQ